MSSYSDIAKSLGEALRLTQAPVAIGFAEQVPAGVAMWQGPIPAGGRFLAGGVAGGRRVRAARGVVARGGRGAGEGGGFWWGQYTHGLAMSAAASADLQDA